MRLDVGTVAPSSAAAWIEWAHGVLGDLRNERASPASLPAQVLDDIGAYLDEWERTTLDGGDTFRWRAEVDPDELEYVTNAFYNLDTRLSAENGRGESGPGPAEGRVFYLVLVRALLHALALASPARAAFVDQLRWSWPSSAEAE